MSWILAMTSCHTMPPPTHPPTAVSSVSAGCAQIYEGGSVYKRVRTTENQQPGAVVCRSRWNMMIDPIPINSAYTHSHTRVKAPHGARKAKPPLNLGSFPRGDGRRYETSRHATHATALHVSLFIRSIKSSGETRLDDKSQVATEIPRGVPAGVPGKAKERDTDWTVPTATHTTRQGEAATRWVLPCVSVSVSVSQSTPNGDGRE